MASINLLPFLFLKFLVREYLVLLTVRLRDHNRNIGGSLISNGIPHLVFLTVLSISLEGVGIHSATNVPKLNSSVNMR